MSHHANSGKASYERSVEVCTKGKTFESPFADRSVSVCDKVTSGGTKSTTTCHQTDFKAPGSGVTTSFKDCFTTSPGKATSHSHSVCVSGGKTAHAPGGFHAGAKATGCVEVNSSGVTAEVTAEASIGGPGGSASAEVGGALSKDGTVGKTQVETCVGHKGVESCIRNSTERPLFESAPKAELAPDSRNPSEHHYDHGSSIGPLGYHDSGCHHSLDYTLGISSFPGDSGHGYELMAMG